VRLVKRIAILGSTGSIGQSALAVVDAHPERLSVVGLAAGGNTERLAAQIATYHPRIVAMASGEAVDRLRREVPHAAAICAGTGRDGMLAVASHPDADIVLCASSGTEALEAVLAAIECGKDIALANKEVLVMAGGLVTAAARRKGVRILPVDSEHNAVHQCLHGHGTRELKRIVLTASGGPFRDWDASQLQDATVEDALRHPTWRMGRKITVDSATLMNKGLEVIEAHWLFDLDATQIGVVVHPQSVIHSMVEFVDGSILAQLGVTDMRLPIQYAFSYPERWPAPMPSLDLTAAGGFSFEPPDLERFPCLRLAYDALTAGHSLPVVLNAANEVAVGLFLEGRLGFPAIAQVVEATMAQHRSVEVGTVALVRSVDAEARELAQVIARRTAG
jgi:1-deoxy-D-xylulose-5-phosphate reductoisomerase